jgi:hypothetical protein
MINASVDIKAKDVASNTPLLSLFCYRHPYFNDAGSIAICGLL